MVVQPEEVHFDQESGGWVSVVRVQACWALVAAMRERAVMRSNILMVFWVVVDCEFLFVVLGWLV